MAVATIVGSPIETGSRDVYIWVKIGHNVSAMFRWPVTVPAFVRFGGSGRGGAVAPPCLETRPVSVGGKQVAMGVADGGGPTVLFLHGWGLSHHSYAPPVRALAGAGFQVLAPDLPGFGGTADLAAGKISYGGFAGFLSELLGEVEGDEPVHVVGHSFGGGVAAQFAHDFPERVRSLVLVDAVSGATWTRSATQAQLLASRPLWDWAYHLMLELPMGAAPRSVPGILGEVVVNLVKHPASLGLTAHLIRRSDLRNELTMLCERRVPVTVVWGSGDQVVPRAAFEDLCEALGVAGQTVPGTHSWPISAPGRFAEVVGGALRGEPLPA
jgi:pimeloyl-ACP methyl ester carboxylesterase